MATVPGSRSGAGGKIVTNRRKQRFAATPYDRPQPPHPPPPPKSPNWFTGVVIPSARALASGAGKILSSAIFSDSESSSSEDEDFDSEDDIDNVNEYENAYDGVTSYEMMQNGHKSLFSAQRTETKRIIEQLIMQETFSRQECDSLKQVLNSRVVDGPVEVGEKRSLADSPEDVDIFNKAVLEAKKWFQEKKVGSSSVTEFTNGTCNLTSTGLEHVESGGGSPVDVARSYMRERPPWASPTEHVESRTPLTTKVKLFSEGTSFSVNYDSLSSKRRNTGASGSWNIQDELRRVRSKATDDMLRTPPAKIDPSVFVGAGEVLTGIGERMAGIETSRKNEPIATLMDVGVSSDPALIASDSRQECKASEEVPSSNPAVSVSGNKEDSEAIQINGECDPSKFPDPTSPNLDGEHHADQHETNGPPATEVAESGGQHVNGFSSSQASLSAGVAKVQNHKQYDEETHNEQTESEKKSTEFMNVEGKCEFLTEAYMEVPIVTETDSIAAGSQNSLGMQYEELSTEMTQTTSTTIMVGKQQGRKPSTRRSRGRGK